jgi:hypothetical protein
MDLSPAAVQFLRLLGDRVELPFHGEGTAAPVVPSLVSICRQVIVTYLEQYTPDSFAICDLDEWEEIVRLRWRTAQPQRFMHARLKEVVPHKVLFAIETANPHLENSSSSVTDRLLWQDCVELTFPPGGVTRPRELLQPWSVLVERLRTGWALHQPLFPGESPTKQHQFDQLKLLYSTTWNVALLRDTGLGKAVKHGLQKEAPGPHRDALQQLLEAWKTMAAEINAANAVYVPPTWPAHWTRDPADMAADLQRAERATTWKQLFAVLQERKQQTQKAQGARMRSRRNDAAQSRPKLVSVRPVAAAPATATNERVAALRQEVRQQASHLSRPQTKTASSSFGDAVAFCAVSTKGQKRKAGVIQSLGNGKQMKIPATKGGTVATLRATGSRWKLPPHPHPKK